MNQVRAILEKAMDQAEARRVQPQSTDAIGSPSKAETAIKKLREDRRLSREELDRPMTI